MRGTSLRIGRESDLQYVDISFHRLIDSTNCPKAWSYLEQPDVMAVDWGGSWPLKFPKVKAFGKLRSY